MPDVKIIDVNLENVERVGYFCRMSKMKTEGNQRKLKWLKQRFDEGLRIKMLELPERGFIEYIPGEYSWRAIEAKDYMFIHCLWVVGKSKGKGFGDILINECLKDAERQRFAGVATIASYDNWTANKNIFLKNGFEIVDDAIPSFNLLVKKFRKVKNPLFTDNWERNQKKHKDGLTLFLTDQCPYNDDAAETMRKYATENNIHFKIIKLKSAYDVRAKSPSPYGTFNIVYNGKLLSYCYLLPSEIDKKIKSIS